MTGALAWLDTAAGLALVAVAIVGWRRFRTSAVFAAAAASAWFIVPIAPLLVLLHRPLLLHSVVALSGRRSRRSVSWALLVVAWIAVVLPLSAQPWAAVVTAVLAIVVARGADPSTRPALVAMSAGLVLPVVERAVWTQYSDVGLPLATYLCAVIVCSATMIGAMLGSSLHEADPVIELWDRTPDQAVAELRRVAAQAETRRDGALASALTLLEENLQLQRDLDERIAEVRTSRARLIDAASGERERLERVLSEGALRYLDELELVLRSLTCPAQRDRVKETCLEEVTRLRDDLEQLARGLHPRVLSDRGLREAVEQLCCHSPVPVDVRVPSGRFPERTETTLWYACAEALANVWKHAQASQVVVHVEESAGALRALVRDDGVGGARLSSGGGLAGLADRLSDVDGTMSLTSGPAGTDIMIEVPRR